MAEELTADRFIARMQEHQSDAEREKLQRYFKTGKGEYGEGDTFMGIRMGTLFELAKEFVAMEPSEIDKLLLNPVHEVRAGALSIMDKQARIKKTPANRRKELCDLYMNRIDRINNWDLVDLAAPFVVGGYLFDKPRDVLYEMAVSTDIWQRRSAITATFYFIRQKDFDDTYRIAEILIDDDQDLIHKAAGGGLRWAGASDPARLKAFLDRHAATMPRTFLRYAIEHFSAEDKAYYMGLKKATK